MNMQFGDYVWSQEPDILLSTHDEITGKRKIRGIGEFTGEGAYDEFKKLASLAYIGAPGRLIHPRRWSGQAWFVDLRLLQEPRADYVKYEFEFWEAQP